MPRLGPNDPSQPTTTSATIRRSRPSASVNVDRRVVGLEVVQGGVGDLVVDLLAGRGPRGDQVLLHLGLPVHPDRPAGQVDEVEVVPLVAATAGRCRGAGRPRAPAARRARTRAAGRPWTARGCRRGSGTRRTPPSGSRPRSTRRRRRRAGGRAACRRGRRRRCRRGCAGRSRPWRGVSGLARPPLRAGSAGRNRRRSPGRCPGRRPAAPRPAWPGPASGWVRRCRATATTSRPPADRDGDRAGAEAHLLDGGGVVVAQHVRQLAPEPPRLGDGVRRDPRQLGEHLGAGRRRARARAAPCRRRSRASAAASRRCSRSAPTRARAAGRGRAPRCPSRTARCTVARVAPYRSWRYGDATSTRPAWSGRQQAEVPQPPADDVLARAGARQRAPLRRARRPGGARWAAAARPGRRARSG